MLAALPAAVVVLVPRAPVFGRLVGLAEDQLRGRQTAQLWWVFGAAKVRAIFRLRGRGSFEG